MAASAGRATVSKKLNDKKRLELELAAKRQEDQLLDEHQRELLLEALREDDRTLFLANLSEGLPADHVELEEGQDARHEEVINWDDYTGAKMPVNRPHFISPWHYKFLCHLFRDDEGVPYNHLWLDAYLRSLPPEGRRLVHHKAKYHEHKGPRDPDAPAWVLRCNEFILVNQYVCGSAGFNSLVVVCIIIAGVLVGVQSYPSMEKNPATNAMDLAVQGVFTAECLLKIFAEGRYPHVYWTGGDWGWNNFDFWLVFICWIPMGGNVAFLRLLRLMRLLKLVGKVKRLQVIVMGLIKGLASVTYIMVLMSLIFYLFAVMGVDSFRENDPFHFGSLGVAMLTLFRCATLEDWTDIM